MFSYARSYKAPSAIRTFLSNLEEGEACSLEVEMLLQQPRPCLGSLQGSRDSRHPQLDWDMKELERGTSSHICSSDQTSSRFPGNLQVCSCVPLARQTGPALTLY